MTKRRRIVLIAAVGAAVAALIWFWPGRPEQVPTGARASAMTDTWMQVIEDKAEHGYWFVVRGTHIGDQAVAAVTAAGLSHAAVYDRERGEVIEAIGKGVVRTPVRELVAQAHRLLIIRPRGYTADGGTQAVVKARGVVGYKYDWLGLVAQQSDRRFYCTELCAWAYGAREQGWMPKGVLRPEQMKDIGEVVFDSGPRDELVPIATMTDEKKARFAARIDDVKGVAYAAKVNDGLYRGGAPDAEGVAWLSSLGIRTVLNLRHYHGDSEGELVEKAGMRYERIKLESSDHPKPDQVKRFFDIIDDPKALPVYVHCLHGVDRTGAMVALYRIDKDGWSNTDALTEMEWFGAHGLLHDLRQFVGAYSR